MEFKNRIVMIGYGIVAQALLPLLLKHLRVSPANVVVIDFADREAALRRGSPRASASSVNASLRSVSRGCCRRTRAAAT